MQTDENHPWWTVGRHTAYTRYPQLMGTNYHGTAGDYINSQHNLRFTKWKKTFVIFPKTTVSGNRIWLKTCWKRRRWMHVEPPQFPVKHFNKTEYAELSDLLTLKFIDKENNDEN